ncbi:MAG TPA: 4'-phosphopantetheinyl transferase superfamily protein [Candidatus Acidoferrum sp.]|nr:4'-phosphopantetheinyl transferase superfamily protein [Candidatus Acidoferrum sp.]
MPAQYPTSQIALLSRDSVQLWLLQEPVDLAAGRADTFAAWLDKEERERWQLFQRVNDRQSFLLAHGLVRGVLARYCGCEPAALRFSRDTHGKPHLLTQDARLSALRFNLSHTRGFCVLAVTVDAEIGVDVEDERRAAEMLALAQRYFSPDEVQWLQQLDASALRAGFFRLWTLKEAYVKARGVGLKLGLDTFTIGFAGAGEPRLLLSEDADASQWSCHSFSHAEHFHIGAFVHSSTATWQIIHLGSDEL